MIKLQIINISIRINTNWKIIHIFFNLPTPWVHVFIEFDFKARFNNNNHNNKAIIKAHYRCSLPILSHTLIFDPHRNPHPWRRRASSAFGVTDENTEIQSGLNYCLRRLKKNWNQIYPILPKFYKIICNYISLVWWVGKKSILSNIWKLSEHSSREENQSWPLGILSHQGGRRDLPGMECTILTPPGTSLPLRHHAPLVHMWVFSTQNLAHTQHMFLE